MEAIINFGDMGHCTIKILDDDIGTINIVESPGTYLAKRLEQVNSRDR